MCLIFTFVFFWHLGIGSYHHRGIKLSLINHSTLLSVRWAQVFLNLIVCRCLFGIKFLLLEVIIPNTSVNDSAQGYWTTHSIISGKLKCNSMVHTIFGMIHIFSFLQCSLNQLIAIMHPLFFSDILIILYWCRYRKMPWLYSLMLEYLCYNIGILNHNFM